MTKQEFVAEVARRSQLTARDAGKAVDAFLETITDTLKGGGDVAFTGFRKFSAQQRAARTGVAPTPKKASRTSLRPFMVESLTSWAPARNSPNTKPMHVPAPTINQRLGSDGF